MSQIDSFKDAELFQQDLFEAQAIHRIEIKVFRKRVVLDAYLNVGHPPFKEVVIHINRCTLSGCLMLLARSVYGTKATKVPNFEVNYDHSRVCVNELDYYFCNLDLKVNIIDNTLDHEELSRRLV